MTGIAAGAAFTELALTPSVSEAVTAPNFTIFMADDADSRIPLSYLPNIHTRIANLGINYINATVPLSECEPSRATFQTGEVQHNHGCKGWNDFKLDDSHALPVWMQQAPVGYYTAFIGKYFTDYGQPSGTTYLPPGWDFFAAINGEQTFAYYGPIFNVNGVRKAYADDQYVTDVIVHLAQDAIAAANAAGKPLFLVVCFLAPHGGHGGAHENRDNCPVPKDELFGTVTDNMPMRTDWGEQVVSDKPQWVRRLPLPDWDTANYCWQRRIEAMKTVDVGVGRILDSMQAIGRDANTYRAYFSDNGYMLGEHRWTGKIYQYEESIRVPMMICGPKITVAGVERSMLVQTQDWVATIVDLAGATFTGRVIDGKSLKSTFDGTIPLQWRTAALVELPNGRLRGIRTDNYAYFETNDQDGFWAELYDLSPTHDPYEMSGRILLSDPDYAAILQQLKDSLFGTNVSGRNLSNCNLSAGAGLTAVGGVGSMWCTNVFDPPPA